jgi:hypothetical protein
MHLLTAIAVMGICGFSVVHGWRIAHFSLTVAKMDSSAKQTDTITTWTAVPDVASAALRAELKEKIDSSDPNAAEGRLEALRSILSIKPLSSVDWLSLSVMQLANRQPREQVLKSLKLSMLTGPNEGNFMTERGIFGASLWESLSPDLKRRVAMDLAAGDLGGYGYGRIVKLRGILLGKPLWVRNELRDAMLATGYLPKDVEKQLGF